MNLRPHLEFAQNYLSKSRKLILSLWEDDKLKSELKADKSPVTELDRKIEVDFREVVSRQFPTYSLLGEEFGLSGSDSEFTWVIDPIDGTQSLINRVPTFGTFLALLHNGEPVLGAIDIPVLGRWVMGALGEGAVDERGRKISFAKNKPFTTNDIFLLGTSGSFARNGQESTHVRLLKSFPTARMYYDCFGHYLVAITGISGLVELNSSIWDIVATEAIVKAAGGAVSVIEPNRDLRSLRSSVCGRPEVVEEIERVLGAN